LSILLNAKPCKRLHFTGILGSGMSAIAQYCVWDGILVSGSDRLLSSPDVCDLQTKMEGLGCSLHAQDGSGVTSATDAIVVSTAIEETNPDIAAARAAGVPVVHRSDVLAAIVESKRTIAVAGTSGKSTVTAMIWELLDACGMSPSLISGAGLIRLEERGLVGNAFAGTSDLLVVEADESDGTCAKYKPFLSIFLNVSKDHKPIPETISLFSTLARQSNVVLSNADDIRLANFGATVTFGENGTFVPDKILSVAPSVSFALRGVTYSLPLPGEHNLSNLLAALCVCDFLGCNSECLVAGAADYKGVQRRFAVTDVGRNIRLIDDYAHNPEKIRAAIRAARLFSGRLLAVFQPHGFGPTRFLKDEFVAMFDTELTNNDELFILPIYYAGGTAQKDISSDIIVDLVKAKGKNAVAPFDRRELIECLKKNVRPGDSVLVMGARDPSLPRLVEEIGTALQSLNV